RRYDAAAISASGKPPNRARTRLGRTTEGACCEISFVRPMRRHRRTSYGPHQAHDEFPGGAMSSNHPNVETVNRMTEAIFNQDHDTLAKIFSDDFVFHLRGPDPMAGDHPGLGGFLGVIGSRSE